jgi:hypothetical protein
MRHERAWITAAFLLGALLRLPGLAETALGADEAAHAWRAARAASEGQIVAEGVTSAFLASAQAGLFALVEPNVFLARLPSALCGLALLLVPLLLKDALGATRTMGLALLVAVDPTLVRLARDGAGAGAAVLAAAVAAAGLAQWARTGRADASVGRRWAVVTGAALGVMVTMGPESWSLVPLLGLVALGLRPWRDCAPPLGRAAAAFFASALLASTAGLWAIPWAGAVSVSLTAWLERFARPGDGASLLAIVQVVPLSVLLAIAGIAHAARTAPRRAVLFLIALSWGALLAWKTPGHAAALAVVLVAAAADGLAVFVPEHARWRRRGWLAAAGTLALTVQLASAARPMMPVATVAARPDLEMLAADLERIAVLEKRHVHELPVVVVGLQDDSRLRWALRRERFLRYEPWRPRGEGGVRPVLLSPTSERPAVAPAGYAGTTYASDTVTIDLWVPIER